ncbi:MAG TPA: hypothetical protein VG406_13720 [Isosphaeraceae bacterium]|jgi:hypothetical protein|nr:hypothetical protein [Isosphaeraceae bacterium]
MAIDPTIKLTNLVDKGMLVNQANLGVLVQAVNAGATLVVAAMAPTGYNRQFQHQDWVDFVDPVQAGGNNGFNERFHALESEFDLISAAFSSVDTAVATLQGASPAIGLSLVMSLSDGMKIPVPAGFQASETKFFAFVKIWTANPQQSAGQTLGFQVYATEDGTVKASVQGAGQGILATGIAIAKKGGW